MGSIRTQFSNRVVKWGVLGLALVASTALAAVDLNLVNSRIREVIARLSLPALSANIEIVDFAMRGNVTERWAAKARLAKTSAHNNLDLNLTKLAYVFPQGGKPTAELEAQVTFDFVKAVGQQNVNELSELLPDLILDLLADRAQQYGNALKLSVTIDEIRRDANNDVEFVRLSGAMELDLESLPAGVERAKQPVSKITLSANATRTGFSLMVSSVLNPGYTGFESTNVGLKQILDGLIARDASLTAMLEDIVKQVDSFASLLVSLEPDPQN